MVFLPGYERVPPSQGGGVQFKYGGNIISIRNGHESVHDFVLDVSQTGSQGFLLWVQLKRQKQNTVCLEITSLNTQSATEMIWCVRQDQKKGIFSSLVDFSKYNVTNVLMTSFCLFVSRITQNQLNWFPWDMVEGWDIDRERTDHILGQGVFDTFPLLKVSHIVCNLVSAWLSFRALDGGLCSTECHQANNRRGKMTCINQVSALFLTILVDQIIFPINSSYLQKDSWLMNIFFISMRFSFFLQMWTPRCWTSQPLHGVMWQKDTFTRQGCHLLFTDMYYLSKSWFIRRSILSLIASMCLPVKLGKVYILLPWLLAVYCTLVLQQCCRRIGDNE